MDHQTFDRLTRLFSATGSRCAAWRAPLAGALLGTAPRSLTAAPTTPCTNNGKQKLCGGECCPGRCFKNERCEVCCTGNNIICGTGDGPVCCLDDGSRDPCGDCKPPQAQVSQRCPEFISGSYRRR
jgi:hypothetical protein